MADGTTDIDVDIEQLSEEQTLALLDQEARRYLNISGADFQRAWESGAYADVDRPEVVRVAMLIPGA